MRSYNLTLTDTALFPARLVKITRLDGTVLRIADAEVSITVGSDTFAPLPGCNVLGVKHTLGGEMPSLQIDFAHASGGTIDTADLNDGVWDGATVVVYVVDRNSISSLGDPLFTGSIQPVSFGIHGAGSFDIRGLAAKAEGFIQTYQPMCRTDLFSSLCQLVAASFALSGTVGVIVDRFTITVAGLASPPADEYLNGGTAVSASGFAFEIAGWVQSTLTLKTYLPVCVDTRLTAGEALTLYPGCDKTGTTCRTKFSNKINFQGEDHFLGIKSIVGV